MRQFQLWRKWKSLIRRLSPWRRKLDAQQCAYNAKARAEIEQFKHPHNGIIKRAGKVVSLPFNTVATIITKTPVVGTVIRKASESIMNCVNNTVASTVNVSDILKVYRDKGYSGITTPGDITDLPLRVCDVACKSIKSKYVGMAAGEGAAVGGALFLGPAAVIAAVAADIPAFAALGMRAIGEYATYYGFDVQDYNERLFILEVLNYASSRNGSPKNKILTNKNLNEIMQLIAKRATWKQLNEKLPIQVIRGISEQLTINLTKTRLSALIPVIGMAFNGGFNAFMMKNICDTAYMLYRERFLDRQGS